MHVRSRIRNTRRNPSTLFLIGAAGLQASTPLSFATSNRWQSLVRKSIARYGATWLHELHLAVAAADVSAFTDAKAHAEASIKLRKSALGYRNLAVMAGSTNVQFELYAKAWAHATAHTRTRTGTSAPTAINTVTGPHTATTTGTDTGVDTSITRTGTSEDDTGVGAVSGAAALRSLQLRRNLASEITQAMLADGNMTRLGAFLGGIETDYEREADLVVKARVAHAIHIGKEAQARVLCDDMCVESSGNVLLCGGVHVASVNSGGQR